MPETGEQIGANPESVQQPPSPEVKNPNEKFLLLGEITQQVVEHTIRTIERQLMVGEDTFGLSHKKALRIQIDELQFLLRMSATIKSGDKSLVPTSHKIGEEDGPEETSFRLIVKDSKLKTPERGGLNILNLKYVRAPENQSALDQAYAQGLRGGIRTERLDEPIFMPPAQEAIFINTINAWQDSTGKVRSTNRSGFVLTYNRGDNVEGTPISRVGATIYRGNTPYVAGIKGTLAIPQFRYLENLVKAGK